MKTHSPKRPHQFPHPVPSPGSLDDLHSDSSSTNLSWYSCTWKLNFKIDFHQYIPYPKQRERYREERKISLKYECVHGTARGPWVIMGQKHRNQGKQIHLEKKYTCCGRSNIYNLKSGGYLTPLHISQKKMHLRQYPNCMVLLYDTFFLVWKLS